MPQNSFKKFLILGLTSSALEGRTLLFIVDAGLSIKDVAERMGISAHALRYYDSQGLLGHVGRTVSGHRRFSDDDLQAVKFITWMRATGMSIRLLKRYMAAYQGGDESGEQRIEILLRHQQEIQRQIKDLEACVELINWKVARFANQEHLSVHKKEQREATKSS